MAITVVFDPPLPTDPPATFDSKAFTALGDLNDWSTQANAVANQINGAQPNLDIVAGNIANINAAVADLPALSAKVSKTGDTMTGNLNVPSINGGQLAGMRNKIINGTGDVNQRGLTSVADDTYFIDRFYVLTESGNVAVAQVTDPESGAPFGFRLTQPDATAKRIGFATIIESKNIRQYASQAMNFFARVKLSAGTGIRYAIIEHTGTADVVTSDVVNNWASTTFTPSNFFIAGINILKTGVVTPGAATFGEINDWSALGASVKNVILFVWSESTLAQNGTLEANRIQYEPGVVATPFEWRLNELHLAQWFYEKSSALASSPSSAVQPGLYSAYGQLAGSIVLPVRFLTQKRAAPSIRSWDKNGNGPNAVITYTSAGVATTRTPTFSRQTENSFYVSVTTSDVFVEFQWDADCEL